MWHQPFLWSFAIVLTLSKFFSWLCFFCCYFSGHNWHPVSPEIVLCTKCREQTTWRKHVADECRTRGCSSFVPSPPDVFVVRGRRVPCTFVHKISLKYSGISNVKFTSAVLDLNCLSVIWKVKYIFHCHEILSFLFHLLIHSLIHFTGKEISLWSHYREIWHPNLLARAAGGVSNDSVAKQTDRGKNKYSSVSTLWLSQNLNGASWKRRQLADDKFRCEVLFGQSDTNKEIIEDVFWKKESNL